MVVVDVGQELKLVWWVKFTWWIIRRYCTVRDDVVVLAS